MVKLKVNKDCVLCGACVYVEGSCLELVNGAIKVEGECSAEVAKELIELCPVGAIKKA